MSRDTSGTVTITTQVASTGAGAGGTSAATGGGGNNSQTKIENKVQHHFWETLEKNIKDLLRETDKILPDGSSETTIERMDQQATTGTGSAAPAGRGAATAPAGIAGSPNAATLQQSGTTVVKRTTFREAAAVIVNPESGILTVRATSRQHEKVQEFLSQVMASARRQVLIEATVAEVSLSDNFQQGINWAALPLGSTGFRLIQQAAGGITAPASSLLELGYANATSRVGNISGTVKLLDAFGTVKVLSSPKLSVLNNQTAVLKVVDNLVYFTIKADTTANQTTTTTTYTTNVNSVPVGLVMNVTPQVSESDAVLLNIRPSISRKFGEVIDPNPDLQRLGVKNAIPVIRTREMESMIRVENGNIAVMGGLMEDSLENNDNAIPGIARIPVLGNFFQNRDDTRRKTELVIFLRPIVVKDASIDGDYASFRGKLPGQRLFRQEPWAERAHRYRRRQSVSLLMDALKKAEQAKQLGQADPPSAATRELSLGTGSFKRPESIATSGSYAARGASQPAEAAQTGRPGRRIPRARQAGADQHPQPTQSTGPRRHTGRAEQSPGREHFAGITRVIRVKFRARPRAGRPAGGRMRYWPIAKPFAMPLRSSGHRREIISHWQSAP